MSADSARTAVEELFRSTNTVTGNEWEAALLSTTRNISAPLAKKLLSQMGLAEDASNPIELFENACGVGVVAPLVQEMVKPTVLKQSKILCGDTAEPMLELAKKRLQSEGWVNTEVKIVDAQSTGLPDGAFTHVATNLGFHTIHDSQAALNETIRVLRPGGVLGLTTWHTHPGMVADIKEAFASFPFDAPFDFPDQITPWGRWSDVNWIRRTLVGKGLEDVKVDVFAFLSPVESADEFLSSFAVMIDMFMKTGWSEEVKKEHPRDEVLSLVKTWLEKKYGDEKWDYSCVAVVASGRVPS